MKNRKRAVFGALFLFTRMLFLQIRLPSCFRNAPITELAISGVKKTRTKMFRVSFKWVQGVDLNH